VEKTLMTEISAGLVKTLREKTGAGMMDCKKALTACGGDLEEAVDWLRKQGLSAAAKKSGRIASEGLIGLCIAGKSAAMVEVNSETDFVARNQVFQEFVRTVAGLAVDAGGDIERLSAMGYPGAAHSVREEIVQRIATIGENMNLRRTAHLAVDRGVLAAYVHAAQADGLGRLGVLVALNSDNTGSALETLGKQLAMHIAAANPQSVARADLPAEVVEREKNIFVEQARSSGKPEPVIEKMVQGRLNKFYQEVCLLEQIFVVDGENRIADLLERVAKEQGAAVSVGGFVRFALGEGIERQS
jgi:elongation factor Ts